MKNLITKLAGMALAIGLAATGAAQAGKIDEIRERGTVRIGVSLGGEPSASATPRTTRLAMTSMSPP